MESLNQILDVLLSFVRSRKGQAAIVFILGSFGLDIEPELQAKLIAVIVSVLMAAIAIEDAAMKFNAFSKTITFFEDDDGEGEVFLN